MMRVEIKSFPDAGKLREERLVLRVLSDVDLGDYAVFCSETADDGTPVAGRKRAFWFPDYEVKTGDLIVLYTKSGSQSKKDWKGKTAHFFYWGLDAAIWVPTVSAVVLLVSEWEFKIVG